MALIVEDGTGKSDAESYISVNDADTYHSNLGNTSWASLTTAVKEQLLRKATNYMLQVYRSAWQGIRTYSTQKLDWPRYNVVIDEYVDIDSDTVPSDVANACAELALFANSSDLYPNESQAVIREKIGPIETEYDPTSPQATRYKSVDAMLSPYFSVSGSHVMEMVR